MSIQVTAAIITDLDKFLIAKRASHKHLGGYWEFPGGKVELNESPEDCLAREIKEELNLDIIVNEFFTEVQHDYGSISINLKAYVCTVLSGTIYLHDHEEVKWVTSHDFHCYDFAPADLPIIELLLTGKS